jgi:hypothetical protein
MVESLVAKLNVVMNEWYEELRPPTTYEIKSSSSTVLPEAAN